jgi:hypothetical protein
MTRVQLYAFDAAGHVTHAGAHDVPRVSAAAARRLQREWERWRTRYLGEHPGDYPLRHTAPTTVITLHPIGEPQKVTRFEATA